MHIASQAGHPDTALVFLKKGVPLHMPNKVSTGIKNSSCAKAPQSNTATLVCSFDRRVQFVSTLPPEEVT